MTPDVLAALDQPIVFECTAVYTFPSAPNQTLICDLPAGHTGDHYDETDRLWWRPADGDGE